MYLHLEAVQHKPYIVAKVTHIKYVHLTIDSTAEVHVYTRHSCVHINIQNLLPMFHSSVCNWAFQLALGTALMLGYLCNNIGLVLASLLSGSTDASTSPRHCMTQPSGIPILSPVLFMHVGDPYTFLNAKNLLVSPPFLVFRQVALGIYYPNTLPLPLLNPYFPL